MADPAMEQTSPKRPPVSSVADRSKTKAKMGAVRLADSPVDPRLQQRATERGLLQLFFKTEPEFPDERLALIDAQESETPDFIFTTDSGRKIGIELKAWADNIVFQKKAPRWKRLGVLRRILNSLPGNSCENVKRVAYWPAAGGKAIRTDEEDALRKAFFQMIRDVDRDWNVEWNDRSYGFYKDDFSQWEPLDKHLESVRMFSSDSTKYGSSEHWVFNWTPADTYDPRTTGDLLVSVLDEAINSYGVAKSTALKRAVDACYLVVHYDDQYFYGVYPESHDVTFSHHAHRGAGFVQKNGAGPFDAVFVLVALEPDPRSFRIYPRPSQGWVPDST